MTAAALGLVADIGRVSVRFGLTGGPQGPAPRDVAQCAMAEHATFTDALIAYLKRVGVQGEALPSMLAIAGMPRGDVVNPTGSRWFISLGGIEAVLRIRPRAINEFAANALALPTLGAGDLQPLAGPRPNPPAVGGSYLVIGPGTGLGVAGLVTAGDRLVPIQSEAAHMCFAPGSPDDEKIVAHLRSRGGRVSNEAVLSAGGLLAAYTALTPGARPPAHAEEVTRNSRDPASRAAIASFIGALGGVIGDLVLAFGAWDGVFVTGPIARSINTHLSDPAFRERMAGVGPFRRQLAQVPVSWSGVTTWS